MSASRLFEAYYLDNYFRQRAPKELVFFPGATWACLFWKAGYEVVPGEAAALISSLRRQDLVRIALLVAGFAAVVLQSPGRDRILAVCGLAAAVLLCEFLFYRWLRAAVATYRLSVEQRDGRAFLAMVADRQQSLPAWRNRFWTLVAVFLALVALGAGAYETWQRPQRWWVMAVSALFFVSLAAAMVFVVRGQSLRRRNAELERLIGERTAELERVSRHKSEFLANMSHELRTPLNAIIGFSDVMLTGMAGTMPDKQKEFIGDIRDSGRHLLALINDILDLSKIEAGRMELQRSPLDLERANEEAITLVRGRAERQGIELRMEIEPGIGVIDADERKFKQILLNLLSNAVKFTPRGGVVTLATRRVEDAVRVSVADTGVGMSAEEQGAIFQEFSQVGADHDRRAEGTGLGLALTRRLVELHGGSIRVESAPGRGSTFTFELPVPAT